MGGRGMRLSEGKYDCLVLDYAGNIQRHGPIDAINVKEKKGKGEGEAPIKVCPECETIVHAAVRFCACGHEFPPEWHDVDRVTYSRWPGKDGKPDTMRVDYWNDSNLFPQRIASEFVCVFHPVGYAREKARKWLAMRNMEYSFAMEDGFELQAWHREPTAILLDTRGKYATIIDYRFKQSAESDAA